jgi:hypothetical protein
MTRYSRGSARNNLIGEKHGEVGVDPIPQACFPLLVLLAINAARLSDINERKNIIE